MLLLLLVPLLLLLLVLVLLVVLLLWVELVLVRLPSCLAMGDNMLQRFGAAIISVGSR